MSDLAIDIVEASENGKDAYQIAQELGIPIHWVYEAREIMQEEDCSPFATINS